MSKHTPGPWRLEVGSEHLWIGTPKAVLGKIGDAVAAIDIGPGYRPEYYDRQHANARLIAASPAMYEALQALQAAGSTVLAGLDARIQAADLSAVPVFDGIADLSAALNTAAAALASADGEAR